MDQVVDAAETVARLLAELIGQRFDKITAAERINRAARSPVSGPVVSISSLRSRPFSMKGIVKLLWKEGNQECTGMLWKGINELRLLGT